MPVHFRPDEYDPDDDHDPDDDPPDVHIRQMISILKRQLTGPAWTDDAGVARLERDLELWCLELDRVTLEDHWASGEGDRTLF